jgi:MYXO-CTERM domain-containing protein
MQGLHWYTQVTGEPGATARGLRRIAPEDGGVPLPGVVPPTVPVFNDAGQPLPTQKMGVWRADRSGQLPFLIWLDDPSKDQLDGYIFALGAAYDVAKGDPTVPQQLVDALSADALAIGLRLMRKVQVAPLVTADLAIIDVDGRPTGAHDLSAEEFIEGIVSPTAINGFNALMSLGIMRTLLFMTGDDGLRHFYYDQLVGSRQYVDCAKNSVALMYSGVSTNFSNVNMAFVAAYGVLRYETDPVLAARYRDILESKLYRPGVSRQAAGLGQSFFDFIYAGFSEPDGGQQNAVTQGLSTLKDWPSAPAFDTPVTNCDPSEISAGVCVAIDGTTMLMLESTPAHGGDVAATQPLPMRLRPHTVFMWVSDPYVVNGAGMPVLNPAGDFHAAYWLGRFLRAGGPNISTGARPDAGTQPTMDAGTQPTMDAGTQPTMDAGTQSRMDAGTGPTMDAGTGPTMDAGTGPTMDAGTGPTSSASCGCSSGGVGGVFWGLLVLGLLTRNRQTSSVSSHPGSAPASKPALSGPRQ